MEEESKKRYIKEVLKLAGVAIGITIIFVIIVCLLNVYLPKKFQFDKEIWGSVSDWFTYLATIFGGILIYKTLDSQLKVQNDQYEMKILEKRRYFQEIKPSFSFYGYKSGEKTLVKIASTKRCLILNPYIIINDVETSIINIQRNVPNEEIRFILLEKPLNILNNIYPVGFHYKDVYGNTYFLSGHLIVNQDSSVVFNLLRDEFVEEPKQHSVYNNDKPRIEW